MPAEVKQTGPCNQQIIGQRFEFGGGTLVPNKPLECKLQLGQVGCRDFDITEIDITESDITETDITENDITESDITESDIT